MLTAQLVGRVGILLMVAMLVVAVVGVAEVLAVVVVGVGVGVCWDAANTPFNLAILRKGRRKRVVEDKEGEEGNECMKERV